MDDMFARIWQDLGGRIGGPMTFRVILQPLAAAFFAVKAGLADARTNRPPYFWAILNDPLHRRQLLQEGWKAIARIFALAVAMDVIYQVLVFRWVYPVEVLIVALLLACVPYLLIRGPVGRLARRVHQKEVV
jgi:hypothetical protein